MIIKLKPMAKSKYLMTICSKIICTVLIFSFFSCSQDDDTSMEKTLDLKIENESFRIENKEISSYEECDELFINTQYKNNIYENGNYVLEFRLTKKGTINSIKLYDLTKGIDLYKINSKELFSVTNFKYDNDNYLYFEFKGELLQSNSDISSTDSNIEKKHIEGVMTIKSVIKSGCTSTGL